jgi:hypothetical protein
MCCWHHTNKVGTSDIWPIYGPFTATDAKNTRSLEEKKIRNPQSFICSHRHRQASANYKLTLSPAPSKTSSPLSITLLLDNVNKYFTILQKEWPSFQPQVTGYRDVVHKFSSIEPQRETIIEEMTADVQNCAGPSNTCRYCKLRHFRALISGNE